MLYQQALDQKPEDLYTLRLIGEAYYLGKEDPVEAYNVFQSMLSLAPEKGDGYFAIGQLRGHQQKYDEAEQWFIRALERDTNNPYWWFVRANTARNAQKLQLALDIYTQTVQQFPNYAHAYFEMAWAYKLNDQPEQAINAIELALDRQQIPNAWYFVRAGEIYEWAGERAQARSAYLEALAFKPGNLPAQRVAQGRLLQLDTTGE